MSLQRIRNSSYIPDYLTSVELPVGENSELKKVFAEETVRQSFESGVMSREAFNTHVESNYHGHGYREAKADGSIWVEHNGKIYRKQDSHKEVLAILEQINQ